ncbi:HlyD family secretion protein [Jeongeupia naejangsanensis]|uniref:HlyD family secretion protein n=1 Tax=Jeongeupia naejangsanensis TaxID=613195 RepID=A0ABS2BGS3_9NEIS|nr:HlyD family secretion protein [Jeongeupia naejangsanensis]MBM3114804.1 HlyD family secretion protein [Jeongeupia naejangsanensis]
MDILLILTYTAICYCVFKVFKVPVNKWTVPTAFLGGVFLIGALLLIMNYNHPYSDSAQKAVITSGLSPLIKGEVIQVTDKVNVPMKKGELIYRIDPTAFLARRDALKASLVSAEHDVLGLQASLDAADAQIKQQRAIRDKAFKDSQRFSCSGLSKENCPYAERDITTAQQNLKAEDEKLNQLTSNKQQINEQLNSQIGGVNAKVVNLQAQLKEAQFNLDNTVVRAPTDGYVTQLLVKPGQIATPFAMTPLVVFVSDSQRKNIIASFRQNASMRLEPGNEAEIVFTAIPGEVFKGKVVQVMPAIADGAYRPSGVMQSISVDPKQNGIHVEISLDNPPAGLVEGIAAQVAVYSEHFHHVAIIRRVLLRMTSWLHYLYFDH